MADDARPQRGGGRAALSYNVYRLGLLLVCLGIGWLIGLPTLTLVVSALFVSGVLSWFLLRRQRESWAMAVERTVARGQAKMAERTAAEDDYVDAVQAAQTSQAATAETSSSAAAPGDQPQP
jgi:hypothetical protein